MKTTINEKNREKISVIVPIYNGEKDLHACLDSILSQELKEIELICIDDASTDSTKDILREYQRKDHRIVTVFNHLNCGAGASRNFGLHIAKGKYVIFLDADDIFETNMLVEAYHRIETYKADICIFREDQFFHDSREYMPYPYSPSIAKYLENQGVFSPDKVKDILFNLWNGWAWDKLFRREFILENNFSFQEIRSSEDGFFVHAALATAKNLTFLNQRYVHHRINRSSSLSNSRDSSWMCCYTYLHALRKYLIEQQMFLMYEKSFINWSSDFLYWNYWSLNEESRRALFVSLKQYMLNELGLLNYEQCVFYNDYYYWFIHAIEQSESYDKCKIPVEERERWTSIFQWNECKINEIFQWLKKNQYNAAIWGAGIRGEALLNQYADKSELKKIYDKDKNKVGVQIKEGYTIEAFHAATAENIQFIFVTNTYYAELIAKEAKMIRPEINVFDLEQYIFPSRSLPMSFSECFL